MGDAGRKRPAVFLDRDGTINEQMGYINHISRFIMLPESARSIRMLNEKNIPVFVVTNQSGLARGYFPASLVEEVHARMIDLLDAEGAKVDGIYVCPHHPEAKEERYRLDCDCRKPKPGLFMQAAREHGIDLDASYVVGDRWSDLKAAAACGASGLLVLTGYGRGDLEYIGPTQPIRPDYVAENLTDAASWIISSMQGN
jgi:D-glycero-D-manno-heptose 1,7-bisphosphate phosphatase